MVGNSQRVQETLLRKYIEPARRQREGRVRVVAGDLVRDLSLWTRVPQVCAAMQTQKFLRQHQLEIIETEGPPSGQSTTVAITYGLQTGRRTPTDELFMGLRGIFRDAYAEEGGGERHLKRERAAFVDRLEPK